MAQITYTDKVAIVSNPNPTVNKWTDDDANEVKSVVNANENWRGAWAGTTAFPVNADNVGSSANGDILAGNVFVLTNEVSFGGSIFAAKSIIIALQNSPTTLSHWSVLGSQI